MKTFFKNWDYKKHAKFVTCVYAACYAVDMTLGYVLIKKLLQEPKKHKAADSDKGVEAV